MSRLPAHASYVAIRGIDARVAGDIGCYTLATIEPLRSIDTCVSMGSSIANAVGIAAGTETKPIIATIGNSTFLHAGIPPLIDAVYNDANITVMILDNHITAMTGGQHHPGTGRTCAVKQPTGLISSRWCARAASSGYAGSTPTTSAEMYQTFREAAAFKGVSVVISDRPCVIDPVRIKGPTLAVNSDGCTACQSCMNLGCPALGWMTGCTMATTR